MNRIMTFIVSSIVFLLVLMAAAPECAPASRYASLLKTGEGTRKLTELARMEEARSIDLERITRLSGDRNPLIRLRCAEVIGRVGDPAGVPVLERLAGDSNEGVKEASIFYLGLVGHESSVPPLLKVLSGTGLKYNHLFDTRGLPLIDQHDPNWLDVVTKLEKASKSKST